MQSNKIGEKTALFWVAWAFVAEKAQNYKLTDQIFQKGIRKLAEPKDLLQKRYQQFQRRLARIYLNNADMPPSESVIESSRRALGTLTKQQVRSGLRGIDQPSVFPQQELLRPQSSNRNADIFVEQTSQPSLLVENSHWTSFKGVSTQSKENAGVRTTWSEAPLRMPSKDRRPLHPTNPSQDVFVEEQFRNVETQLPLEKPPRAKPGTSLDQL